MQEGHTIRSAPPPAAPPPTAPPASPWKTKLKRAAIWTVVALVALGGAYGAGRFQTSAAIDAAKAETAKVSESKASIEQTLVRARQQLDTLEARRQLHLAALALDQRNFGIAQDHLSRAAALLAAGQATGELETIRATLTSFKLLATENLETQRARLLELTRRFDTAVPPGARP